MNACETKSHHEPLNLDERAKEHFFRMINLRDLVAHLEDYVVNELPPSREAETIEAIAFAAKEIAVKAYEEADCLNVSSKPGGYALMAMPGAADTSADDGWQRVRAALLVVTDPEATAEEMANVLDDIHELALDDEAFDSDLDMIIHVIELRGYEVGWLTFPTGRRPHLAPRRDDGQAGREAGAAIDVRACLTAEEIELAARSLAAGLEGYLVSALSHPANDAQKAGGGEHAQA